VREAMFAALYLLFGEGRDVFAVLQLLDQMEDVQFNAGEILGELWIWRVICHV
jgi:hypothetical protein